jgi:hypothetical protein
VVQEEVSMWLGDVGMLVRLEDNPTEGEKVV